MMHAMKKPRKTGGKASVGKPKLQRRKRALVMDFYREPEQPDWNLGDKDWEKIEDEYLYDLDSEVRDTICDIISDYFYFRELELSAIKLNDAQDFLSRVRGAAATLAMLLAAEPTLPAIAATRDVLREALFDPLNPSFDPNLFKTDETFDAELSDHRAPSPDPVSFKSFNEELKRQEELERRQAELESQAAFDAIERTEQSFDDIVPHLARLI
jgi:hypothetical protein